MEEEKDRSFVRPIHIVESRQKTRRDSFALSKLARSREIFSPGRRALSPFRFEYIRKFATSVTGWRTEREKGEGSVVEKLKLRYEFR